MSVEPARFFFDTEFIETGSSIHLISIGIVADDGREFYAEITDDEIPWDIAHPWVLENVRPLLNQTEKWQKKDLGYAIMSFVAGGVKQPQFWAWFGAYDWVAMCQIFGSMVKLPIGWPMYVMDLKQWAEMIGNPTLPRQKGDAHNALEDARWNRQVFDRLRLHAKTRPAYVP